MTPHPPRGRPFEKGNPGKPKGARPISERRVRKLLESSIVAEVAGPQMGDFDGDALGYLQAVYRGERIGDPLRLSAAGQALKFERPALAATLTRDMTPIPGTPAEIDKRITELLRKGL